MICFLSEVELKARRLRASRPWPARDFLDLSVLGMELDPSIDQRDGLMRLQLRELGGTSATRQRQMKNANAQRGSTPMGDAGQDTICENILL
jgi:hypothetical protein